MLECIQEPGQFAALRAKLRGYLAEEWRQREQYARVVNEVLPHVHGY
jgi:hypothetical protein